MLRAEVADLRHRLYELLPRQIEPLLDASENQRSRDHAIAIFFAGFVEDKQYRSFDFREAIANIWNVNQRLRIKTDGPLRQIVEQRIVIV